ncbi:MAG: hypothetical protein NT159_18405 [Proteobacteria bacterium]|nr:hypothetical protein [Pseudomonadota bacterium]
MLLLKDEEVLVELERIDQAIGASETLLETLRRKRLKLDSHLDNRTRPTTVVSSTTTRRQPGVFYRGEFIVCRKTVRMHTTVLRRLWKDFPEQRDAMAAAMAACGYSRNYVARTREGLFDGFKSSSWVRRYSEDLVNGWYVDTNMSSRDLMQRVLRQAAKVVGLKWSEDIQIVWANS